MIENRFNLKNKKALVTGGNTGIGFGIAQSLAKAGAAVAICGRNKEKNEKALAQLKSINENCQAFVYDFENIEGIEGFFKTLSDEMKGIDILVNNAGIQYRGRADEIPIKEFNRVITVNLTAPYFLSQHFARERINSKQPGNIIFTASLMSEAARKTTSPYTASKGGIRQLVRALAVDWAEFNIRVNGLGPGYIQTDMTKPLWQDESFDNWVKGRTPLGRWGHPTDFEGAAVFLASDASSFVTGQILYIDGGWLATF